MRGFTALALSAAALSTAGCQSMIQHNDVLVFGTTTQFAIDVSAAGGATGSPSPNITIGYKRQEAVWMPLIANGTAAGRVWKPNICPSGATPCVPFDQLKYTGHGEGTAANAGMGDDSYSVLASFGAKGTASSTEGPNAGLELAQFFATGIAAQRLASNAAVTQALSIQSPDAAAAGAKAAAVSSAAQTGMPDVVAAAAEGTTAAAGDEALAQRAAACINRKGTDAFAAKLPAGPPQNEIKNATTSAAVLRILQVWADNADIDSATTALCP